LGDAQVTDFNPGIRNNGLFWTTVVDDRAIDVNRAAGTATFRGTNMHMPDFHDFQNSILGNGESPTPAVVSFTVRWTATGTVEVFNNDTQQYHGDMRPATAQMEWSASSGIYEYRSKPLSTSASVFAQIGTERNGSFYG
jgi:hypothetical protein